MSHERPLANLLFHTRCAEPEQSADIHQAMAQMIRWAEGKFTDCITAEHHLSGDGFIATPLDAMAMAVAGGETLKASGNAVLAGLYNPLFLAERIAFLDLTSGGRTRMVFGLGYREVEYTLAEKNWTDRGKAMNTLIEQLLALLSGQTIEINGVKAHLHHLPKTPLSSLILVGGASRPAARRAARFGLGFFPSLDDPELEEIYRVFCDEYNTTPNYTQPRFAGYTLIADDPDKAWSDVGPYLLYDAMAYEAIGNSQRRSWSECSAADVQALRDSGSYHILTPEEGLSQFEAGNHIAVSPLTGGLPVDYGWRCLELFETKMLPHMTLDYRSFAEFARDDGLT